MDVSFINMSLMPDQRPNVGLASVISAVETEHNPQLIDLNIDASSFDSVLARMEEHEPRVLGFSTTSFSFKESISLASFLKRNYDSDLTMVWGGVHPTLLPEETLRHEPVDAVCIGEGEVTLREYLGRLEKQEEPRGVEGIWYKKGDKIIKNRLRSTIQDLDSLPLINWDYWDLGHYMRRSVGALRYLPIETGRGCPFSCTFCSNQALRQTLPGDYYRNKSPERLVREVKAMKERYDRLDIESINFVCSAFGLDREQFYRFCELYRDDNLHKKLPWSSITRAGVVTDKWAKEASKSGCWRLGFGIESGSQAIRNKVYKKGLQDEEILRAARNLNRHNISYHTYSILGGPTETKKDILRTVNFAYSVHPVYSYFSSYFPLPKTELKQFMEDEGLVEGDEVYKYQWNKSSFGTENLSATEVKRLALKVKILEMVKHLKRGFSLQGRDFLRDLIRSIYENAKNNFDPASAYFISYHQNFINLVHRCQLEKWKEENPNFTCGS